MTIGYLLGLIAFVIVFFVGYYVVMRVLAGAIADNELSEKLDKMEREVDGQ